MGSPRLSRPHPHPHPHRPQSAPASFASRLHEGDNITMADVPPEIPPEFQKYNSHKIGPIYQARFTIAWASAATFFILAALPNLVRSVRIGRMRDAFTGIRKIINAYEPVDARGRGRVSPARRLEYWKAFDVLATVKMAMIRTVSVLGLDVGQLILILAYYVTVILCTTLKTELIDNANRPGFIAVAQLVPVFLFASKNSPLVVLLSSGYEKLNFLHRWCARGALIAAAVHGLLWIRDRLDHGLPILSRRKNVTGLMAFGLLCILGISSVRPIRARVYQVFLVTHILSVPAFAIALRYHSKRVIPYLYPALAFWVLDLLLRLFHFRFRKATLIAPDTQMTIIRIHDCASGWTAGQHVRLRVFMGSQMLESHPLTIMNAPQAISCLSGNGIEQELILGARVRGDWSRALNVYVRKSDASLLSDGDADPEFSRPSDFVIADDEDEAIDFTDLSSQPKSDSMAEPLLSRSVNWPPTDRGTSIQVMLDGPYGGCAFDISTFESVLLISGGSGVTFTLGLLDDLVGRCLRLGRRNDEVTRRIEFAWYIREFGALRWIAPFLAAIASRAASAESTLDLHISIYVTHSCKSEGVPPIRNCDVVLERPEIRILIDMFVLPHESSDTERSQDQRMPNSDCSSLAVCAAGPESLTHDVKNVVARFALRSPGRRVDCHTEVYSL